MRLVVLITILIVMGIAIGISFYNCFSGIDSYYTLGFLPGPNSGYCRSVYNLPSALPTMIIEVFVFGLLFVFLQNRILRA